MNKKELGEYIKCAKDPIYFLNKYYYSYNIFKYDFDKINLFDYQEDVLKKINENNRTIFLKSRQVGLSTTVIGYIIWTLLFKSDQRIALIVNNDLNQIHYIKKIEDSIKNLPEFFWKDFYIKSKTRIEIDENYLIVGYDGANPGCSEHLTMIVFDEFAYFQNANSILVSALPTLVSNGKFIIISSPNKEKDIFHNIWIESQKKENSFMGTTIHCTEHPVYSVSKELRKDEFGRSYWWSPWYEEMCKTLNYNQSIIGKEMDLTFESND